MAKTLAQYLETLVHQQQQLLGLLQLICEKESGKVEEWLDNVDVKRILKISDSTLYRLRKNKQLACKKVGHKWYYAKTALTALLK